MKSEDKTENKKESLKPLAMIGIIIILKRQP